MEAFDPVAAARHVLRIAATATLGTLAEDGSPCVSLVTVATTVEGEPLMLLSDLAEHTRNLKRDARASLLLIAPGGEGGDPLAGARVSIAGTIGADGEAEHRRRFLAKHAEAERTAAFGDFRFYRLKVTRAHLVAGFGRIADLDASALLTDTSDCADFIATEASAIVHMNADHHEALALYATRLLGLPPGDWTMTGVDPDGVDLRAGALRGRLAFRKPVQTGHALRSVLAALTRQARGAE